MRPSGDVAAILSLQRPRPGTPDSPTPPSPSTHSLRFTTGGSDGDGRSEGAGREGGEETAKEMGMIGGGGGGGVGVGGDEMS